MTTLLSGLRLLLGLVSGAALFGLMLLTVVDVVGRKFFNRSVYGGVELTELGLMVLIYGALPLVSLAGLHVTFDLLDRFLPRRLLSLQARLAHVLTAIILLGAAGFVLGKAGSTREMGDITAQLAIPVAPFQYGAALLILVAALAHGILALRPGAAVGQAEAAAEPGQSGV